MYVRETEVIQHCNISDINIKHQRLIYWRLDIKTLKKYKKNTSITLTLPLKFCKGILTIEYQNCLHNCTLMSMRRILRTSALHTHKWMISNVNCRKVNSEVKNYVYFTVSDLLLPQQQWLGLRSLLFRKTGIIQRNKLDLMSEISYNFYLNTSLSVFNLLLQCGVKFGLRSLSFR